MQTNLLKYELHFAETKRSGAFFCNGIQVGPDFTCQNHLIKVVLALSNLALITEEKQKEMLSAIIANNKMPSVMPGMMNISIETEGGFSVRVEACGVLMSTNQIPHAPYYGNFFSGFGENIFIKPFVKKRAEAMAN